jgi:Na+-transporting NADH:ubiquinone oxidoreductase subunit B
VPAKPKWVHWQLPMQRVLFALIPVVVAAVYFFGWRVLFLLAVCNAAGFLTEYVFTRRWKEPVTSAVFVTSSLFTLSLPPPIPVWMAVLGVVFAVLFGKMVFGGFGRNIFNPALSGRAFLYVSFGGVMTARWTEPVGGMLGGLVAYAPVLPDAITRATPGILMKSGEAMPSLTDLFWGHTAGVMGGTDALVVLLSGAYLLWTKAANYRIVVSGIAGYLVVQAALWFVGIPSAVEPLHGMLGSSFLFGIFFYATDPVSACQTQEGRWLYGAFIGVMSSLIGVFSAWPAGTMFAILLANMFGPIVDFGIRELKKKKGPGTAVAGA